jgi:hypothetical protein
VIIAASAAKTTGTEDVPDGLVVLPGWEGYRRIRALDKSTEGRPASDNTVSQPENDDWQEQQWRPWQQREAELWKPFIQRYGLGGVLYIDFMWLDPNPPPPSRRSTYDDPKYRHESWPHLPTVSSETYLATWQGFEEPGYWVPKISDKKGEEPHWGVPWDWLKHRQSNHLSLADLGLWAVIEGYDNPRRHCSAPRELLAAEAGLSLDQTERSLEHLTSGGHITTVKRQARRSIRSTKRASQGSDVLRMYKWILARREISITARFLYCLGVNAARKNHTGYRFTLRTTDAAKKLGLSRSSINRAINELCDWELIGHYDYILDRLRRTSTGHLTNRAFLPDTYRLMEHPWQRCFNMLTDLGPGDKEEIARQTFYEE